MPYNREVIASISFETDSSPSNGTPRRGSFNEAVRERGLFDAPGDPMPQQNESTRNIIRCMKWALGRSIKSISNPAKQRALNPKKDFTIEITIEAKAKSKGGSAISCCGGVPAVKHRTPKVLSVNETGTFKSDFAHSDTDDYDDDGPQISFKFTDYSPMCYRHIREFFNIDPMSYCEVLMRSRWHSTPTPGKSAAQLFFCGKDWIIKTMTTEESEFLRSILHRYYFFVLDNPHTLLPHFVGHHRLEIAGEKINFIIMQNVFATGNAIHEKYDLKGSTVGRFATEAEKRKQTCTQKDLDLNRPIHVGPARRAQVIEQIKNDCEFLKRSHVMDYSFLVGIHILPASDPRSVGSGATGVKENLPFSPLPFQVFALDGAAANVVLDGQMNGTTGGLHVSTPEPVIDGRCFTADEGGMRSTYQPGTRREIYYIGIIDILQRYNAWKYLETTFLGLAQDSKKISSVPPREYAERFVAFVSSIIV
ncbi:putative phosphatidylinositol-4-phosphate 5-kinase-like [Trypanosoma rangeli]|uniref:Putative phosphatidylinositol-4-phosphate 5-kinase-like n=1 Tax=Trypanosoma rangeli TaxID=5698 RepID=A0A422N247_TRYRA|nr:putative phosphatidylinositol-4-phosphate 5-kinase-like [Trypanosoma rangeli]RNE99534.1 putative phosphatidylinositol-4-phosphate 5-kinase-like [Trypanosoma rangeli]|eukprot:RNE99534.1 putative phosphatidylinositol-4-phosphate 5-kinase-like [Trypanosoma rangeli]